MCVCVYYQHSQWGEEGEQRGGGDDTDKGREEEGETKRGRERQRERRVVLSFPLIWCAPSLCVCVQSLPFSNTFDCDTVQDTGTNSNLLSLFDPVCVCLPKVSFLSIQSIPKVSSFAPNLSNTSSLSPTLSLHLSHHNLCFPNSRSHTLPASWFVLHTHSLFPSRVFRYHLFIISSSPRLPNLLSSSPPCLSHHLIHLMFISSFIALLLHFCIFVFHTFLCDFSFSLSLSLFAFSLPACNIISRSLSPSPSSLCRWKQHS